MDFMEFDAEKIMDDFLDNLAKDDFIDRKAYSGFFDGMPLWQKISARDMLDKKRQFKGLGVMTYKELAEKFVSEGGHTYSVERFVNDPRRSVKQNFVFSSSGHGFAVPDFVFDYANHLIKARNMQKETKTVSPVVHKEKEPVMEISGSDGWEY